MDVNGKRGVVAAIDGDCFVVLYGMCMLVEYSRRGVCGGGGVV